MFPDSQGATCPARICGRHASGSNFGGGAKSPFSKVGIFGWHHKKKVVSALIVR